MITDDISNDDLHEYIKATNYSGKNTKYTPHITDIIIKRSEHLDRFYSNTITVDSDGVMNMKFRMKVLKFVGFSPEAIPRCAECGANVCALIDAPKVFRDVCYNTSCRKKNQGRVSSQIQANMSEDDKKRSVEKRKQTSLERYGVEHISRTEKWKDNYKKKLMERYGVDNASKISGINDKKRKTNLERYGVEHSSMNEDVKKKFRETMMNTHGVEYSMQSQEILEKSKKTVMNKYGVGSYAQQHITQDTFDVLNDSVKMEELYKKYGGYVAADTLGINNTTFYNHFHKHGLNIDPRAGFSGVEAKLADYIESLGVDIVRNDRVTLNGKEIDIYVPSLKIGFEMNGVYWHSTKFNTPTHLLDKKRECQEAGVKLYHIYDDEYRQRTDQVHRKIARLCKIRCEERVFARKTVIKKVTNSEVVDFLDRNHIQGYVSSSYVYSLEFNGEMVACMTFKKTRGYMELTRYATSCNVIGGFTKLVKAFINDHDDVNELVSFADLRYSDGDVYANNGWGHVTTTKPNYYYVVNGRRENKQKYRRSKLQNKLGDLYDSSLSELANMTKCGYHRIFDCGLMKFSITRERIAEGGV